MTEYAPAAILALFNTVKAGVPSAINAGVVGDSAHTYGYHRCRNVVPGDDYSVQVPPDQQGDGEAACALDLSWGNAADQYTVSQRLLDACRGRDSRLYALREFYGSTDGVNVIGWDNWENYPVTSDDSHLWHVHLSVLRQYSNDNAACQAIASVITVGGTGGGTVPLPPISELEDDLMYKVYYKGNHYLLWGGKILRIAGPADENGPVEDAPPWSVSDTQWRLLTTTYGNPAS